ncbi:MAG TPA: abortive infection system antitoxin AbiGi family protein [Thermoanaerobaculia bacterium]|nr:abortive infection system antitoxin AbiGi family protein [Thermoanaerobaculia bacterium]
MSNLEDMELALSEIEVAAEAAHLGLERFLAFVKTFTRREFRTVYCEREWRATKSFRFKYDDIAMIVLPKIAGKERYFEPFIAAEVRRLKLPRSIPVVPWEDLVES